MEIPQIQLSGPSTLNPIQVMQPYQEGQVILPKPTIGYDPGIDWGAIGQAGAQLADEVGSYLKERNFNKQKQSLSSLNQNFSNEFLKYVSNNDYAGAEEATKRHKANLQAALELEDLEVSTTGYPEQLREAALSSVYSAESQILKSKLDYTERVPLIQLDEDIIKDDARISQLAPDEQLKEYTNLSNVYRAEAEKLTGSQSLADRQLRISLWKASADAQEKAAKLSGALEEAGLDKQTAGLRSILSGYEIQFDSIDKEAKEIEAALSSDDPAIRREAAQRKAEIETEVSKATISWQKTVNAFGGPDNLPPTLLEKYEQIAKVNNGLLSGSFGRRAKLASAARKEIVTTGKAKTDTLIETTKLKLQEVNRRLADETNPVALAKLELQRDALVDQLESDLNRHVKSYRAAETGRFIPYLPGPTGMPSVGIVANAMESTLNLEASHDLLTAFNPEFDLTSAGEVWSYSREKLTQLYTSVGVSARAGSDKKKKMEDMQAIAHLVTTGELIGAGKDPEPKELFEYVALSENGTLPLSIPLIAYSDRFSQVIRDAARSENPALAIAEALGAFANGPEGLPFSWDDATRNTIRWTNTRLKSQVLDPLVDGAPEHNYNTSLLFGTLAFFAEETQTKTLSALEERARNLVDPIDRSNALNNIEYTRLALDKWNGQPFHGEPPHTYLEALRTISLPPEMAGQYKKAFGVYKTWSGMTKTDQRAEEDEFTKAIGSSIYDSTMKELFKKIRFLNDDNVIGNQSIATIREQAAQSGSWTTIKDNFLPAMFESVYTEAYLYVKDRDGTITQETHLAELDNPEVISRAVSRLNKRFGSTDYTPEGHTAVRRYGTQTLPSGIGERPIVSPSNDVTATGIVGPQKTERLYLLSSARPEFVVSNGKNLTIQEAAAAAFLNSRMPNTAALSAIYGSNLNQRVASLASSLLPEKDATYADVFSFVAALQSIPPDVESEDELIRQLSVRMQSIRKSITEGKNDYPVITRNVDGRLVTTIETPNQKVLAGFSPDTRMLTNLSGNEALVRELTKSDMEVALGGLPADFEPSRASSPWLGIGPSSLLDPKSVAYRAMGIAEGTLTLPNRQVSDDMVLTWFNLNPDETELYYGGSAVSAPRKAAALFIPGMSVKDRTAYFKREDGSIYKTQMSWNEWTRKWEKVGDKAERELKGPDEDKVLLKKAKMSAEFSAKPVEEAARKAEQLKKRDEERQSRKSAALKLERAINRLTKLPTGAEEVSNSWSENLRGIELKYETRLLRTTEGLVQTTTEERISLGKSSGVQVISRELVYDINGNPVFKPTDNDISGIASIVSGKDKYSYSYQNETTGDYMERVFEPTDSGVLITDYAYRPEDIALSDERPVVKKAGANYHKTVTSQRIVQPSPTEQLELNAKRVNTELEAANVLKTNKETTVYLSNGTTGTRVDVDGVSHIVIKDSSGNFKSARPIDSPKQATPTVRPPTTVTPSAIKPKLTYISEFVKEVNAKINSLSKLDTQEFLKTKLQELKSKFKDKEIETVKPEEATSSSLEAVDVTSTTTEIDDIAKVAEALHSQTNKKEMLPFVRGVKKAIADSLPIEVQGFWFEFNGYLTLRDAYRSVYGNDLADALISEAFVNQTQELGTGGVLMPQYDETVDRPVAIYSSDLRMNIGGAYLPQRDKIIVSKSQGKFKDDIVKIHEMTHSAQSTKQAGKVTSRLAKEFSDLTTQQKVAAESIELPAYIAGLKAKYFLETGESLRPNHTKAELKEFYDWIDTTTFTGVGEEGAAQLIQTTKDKQFGKVIQYLLKTIAASDFKHDYFI